MKAVRLHKFHKYAGDRRGARAGDRRAVRRDREDRRRRGLPDRPAHHRGPVGRGDGHAAAVHPRPRERGLGARGRLGGHQRRGRRHGDPAPDADLRPVPRLPGRRRHALRATALSRACSTDGGMAEYLLTSRARLRQARPGDPTRGRRGAGRRRASPPTTRSARRSRCSTRAPPAVVIGAGRPRPHRHPVPGRADRDPIIVVVDRNPDALKLAEQLGAAHTVVADGAARRRGQGPHRRRAARRWCSTSWPSRAPRRTAGR